MTTTPPRLDPRTYADFVRQTEALAQRYTEGAWKPGAADSGSALIRLFARMAALVSDRMNRMPEKHFLAFLNLIGARPLPPQPARVPLTFRLAKRSPAAAEVPAGTSVEAAKLSPDDQTNVFETETALTVSRAEVMAIVFRAKSTSGPAPGDVFTHVKAPYIEALTAEPRDLSLLDKIYIGLDKPPENRTLGLFFHIELGEAIAATDSTPHRISARYWHRPKEQRDLLIDDQTEGLSRSGFIRFVGPPNASLGRQFNIDGFWIELSLGPLHYVHRPMLHRVLANTVWAVQARRANNEVLGSSIGAAGQRFTATRLPVLPGERLEVWEPGAAVSAPGASPAAGAWQPWSEVVDFHGSGPQDRHYTIDRAAGEVRFGDGVQGRVPPEGRANLRLTYRHGGGLAGNRAANTITQLKTTIPYVGGVTNLLPAAGGADAETQKAFQERGPKRLRHGQRAVATEDFEDLALEASPGVARARASRPAWGRVRVVIVPEGVEDQPTPTPELIRRVTEHLRARATPTLGLEVVGPKWAKASVTVSLRAASSEVERQAQLKAAEALRRFLHPVTGGAAGAGWPFGRAPQTSDLFGVLEGLPEVDYVPELRIDTDPIPDEARDETLVYSGEHAVALV